MNLINLVRTIYDRVLRPRLPYRISVHNGIPVRGRVRLLDRTDEFPDYETALVSAVRDHVERGDDVVVVGGGIGVSTVVAAQRTVTPDAITVYEGSRDQFSLLERTLELNRVTEYCTARHAVVGVDVGVYGEQGRAEIIDPRELPDCDVLVMDCEGAELEILDGLKAEPDEIIVETHTFLNAPEDEVRDALADLDYEVVNRRVDDETKGAYILTAVKQ